MKPDYETALIVGAGTGFSASLARALSDDGGLKIALASRNPEKIARLADELGAPTFACDASHPDQVTKLFDRVTRHFGATPDVVVYNPSRRLPGPLVDLDPAAVADAIAVTAYGGFLVSQAAARGMVRRGKGAILLTGASASVKGYPRSAAFAMGKFALRGLAQSIARELAPQAIHVIHVIVDGAIRNPGLTEPADAPDSMLDPDEIARTCLHLLGQDRSAWTWEIEIRPWLERF
ncbi:MAG: SDR family oxidoreductase [Rhodospirillales bacterium]|nr:SDR family oxidoreductase [Rhodospirillales bacterium]